MLRAKKIVALGIVGATVLSMAACGSKETEQPKVETSSIESVESKGNADLSVIEEKVTVPTGVYSAVSAEMADIQVNMDEILGDDEPFTIELKENGRAVVQAEGQTGKGKYLVEGDQVILTVLGTKMEGTYKDNSITFENMLDMGVTMTFGLDGTDAVNPENYLSEEDQRLIGEWKSTEVTDILGKEVDIPADALTLNFNKDRTVTGNFNGEEFGPFSWDASNEIFIDSSDPGILVKENEDGTLNVDYSVGEDEYYEFVISK